MEQPQESIRLQSHGMAAEAVPGDKVLGILNSIQRDGAFRLAEIEDGCQRLPMPGAPQTQRPNISGVEGGKFGVGAENVVSLPYQLQTSEPPEQPAPP